MQLATRFETWSKTKILRIIMLQAELFHLRNVTPLESVNAQEMHPSWFAWLLFVGTLQS
jgi:hypothetical protein